MTNHRAEPHLTRQRAGLAALGTAVALAAVAVPPLVLSQPDPATVTSAPPATSAQWSPSTAQSASVPPLPTATTEPARSSPASTIRPSTEPTRVPVKVEAEAAGNMLLGGAEVTSCPLCSGGSRVRYIGGSAQLVVRTTLPTPGRRLTVIYEAEGPRAIKLLINGVPLPGIHNVFGDSWDSPRTFDLAVELPAGQLAITFYNNESSMPDIDAIVIT